MSLEFSRPNVDQIAPSRCSVVSLGCPYEVAETWKGPDSSIRGMTTQGRLDSNWVYTRWEVITHRLLPSIPLVIIFIFHLSHPVVDCSSSSIIPIVLVTKYACRNATPVTLGLGRGNWFSFDQPPLVQALRTRCWLIYCAPTPYRVLCWVIICGRMHCYCSMHPMGSCLVVVSIDVLVVSIALSPYSNVSTVWTT